MGMRSRLGRIGAVGALLITGTVIGAVTQHLASAELSSGDRLVYRPFDAPCRLMDTRPPFQVGPRGTPLGAAETITVAARGAVGECNIPADAEALTINATWVGPTGESFLTFWPEGARPLAATANPLDGHGPTPNETTVGLSGTGSFRIYNNANQVDLVLDVAGFWANHNHDDRYFTEAEVNAAVAASVPRAGDACTIAGVAGSIIEGYDDRAAVSRKCFRAVVSTLAGSGGFGGSDGEHVAGVSFADPYGIAVGPDGTVYVVETSGHVLRRITADGTVTTLAGSGVAGTSDGTGPAAQFDQPRGVAVAGDGTIYVADFGNNRIRKVTPNGTVTTLTGSDADHVDGPIAGAKFNAPTGIAVADDGTIYVGDTFNHRIRAISPGGVVSTLAGTGAAGFADGAGAAAQFNQPGGVTIGPAGDVFVADIENHRIRKVTAAGVVTTFAGSTEGFANGTGTNARFKFPLGVVAAPDGTLFVADKENRRVRKITPARVVTTLAGTGVAGEVDGLGPVARFVAPNGIARANDGRIYVADGQRVRHID